MKKEEDFFKSNLVALRGVISANSAGRIENCHGKSPLISIAKNDATTAVMATSNGRFLHSKRDPLREASRQVKRIFANDKYSHKDTVIIVGLAAGYHIFELVKQLDESAMVLVVDPQPQAVADILSCLDFSSLATIKCELRIFVADTFTDIWNELFQFFYRRLNQPLFTWQHPGVSNAFPDAYQGLVENIDRYTFLACQNWLTQFSFSRIWIANSLGTLSFVDQLLPISNLKDICHDVPAYLIGAGPSLDRHLDVLRSMQSRAVIICAGRALPTLLAAGVEPHFIVEIDPHPIVSTRLKEVTKGLKHCHLVAPLYTCPGLFEQFPDRSFFFNNNVIQELNDWLNSHGISEEGLQTGGTVMVAMIDLANYLGCTDWLFSGLDLAVDADLSIHSAGAKQKTDRLLNDDEKVKVAGNFSDYVISSVLMKQYITGIEVYLASLHHVNKKLLITDAGAKIAKLSPILKADFADDKYTEPQPAIVARLQGACSTKTSLDGRQILRDVVLDLEQFQKAFVKFLAGKKYDEDFLTIMELHKDGWSLVQGLMKFYISSAGEFNECVLNDEFYENALLVLEWIITIAKDCLNGEFLYDRIKF